MPDIGIIVLAAGASTRMGQPKQLLKIGDDVLIRYILKITLQSSCAPVIVVLGKDARLIQKEIDDLPLRVVFNENWNEGMGTSVQQGMGELLRLKPEISAIIFLVVDQPFVDFAIIEKLKQKYFETGKPIIAAKYGKTYGVPALFDAAVFPELLQLKGQMGAKKVIGKYALKQEIAFIDFPEGRFDLDTPEDYEQFLRDL